jgi:hypothetical protein
MLQNADIAALIASSPQTLHQLGLSCFNPDVRSIRAGGRAIVAVSMFRSGPLDAQ